MDYSKADITRYSHDNLVIDWNELTTLIDDGRLCDDRSYVFVVRNFGEREAKWLLSKNDHNRALRASNIKAIIACQNEGRWQESCNTIYISPCGELLNGQHRCAAMLRRPYLIRRQRIAVCPEVNALFAFDNTLKKRTVRDIAKIKGLRTISNGVVGGTKWDLCDFKGRGDWSSRITDVAFIEHAARKNQEMLLGFLPSSTVLMIRQSVAAAAIRIARTVGEEQSRDYEDMFTPLATVHGEEGEFNRAAVPGKDNPVVSSHLQYLYAVHKKLRREVGRVSDKEKQMVGSTQTAEQAFARAIIFAWEMVLRGRKAPNKPTRDHIASLMAVDEKGERVRQVKLGKLEMRRFENDCIRELAGHLRSNAQ